MTVAAPARPPAATGGRRGWVAADLAVSAVLAGLAVAAGHRVLVGLAVAGLGVAAVESLRPLHGTRRTGGALVTDATHALANRHLAAAPAYAALAAVGPGVVGLVPDPVRAATAALPAAARLVLALVLTDLANYLVHRAMHRVPALWRLHAVHHSSEHLDWLATFRSHPLDLAVSLAAGALPAYALGLDGGQPWLVAFVFLYFPLLVHADADVRGRRLGRVVVTPLFHHWHHAAGTGAGRCNYGALLAVWDRLLGTAHDPGRFPDRYGTGDTRLARAGYTGHLLSPLTASGPRRRWVGRRGTDRVGRP